MTATDPEALAAEIQGNILRAYGSGYSLVRHLVLEIQDRRQAQSLIAALIDDGSSGPRVTAGGRWTTRPDPGTCLNIGFTFHGLAALGVPASSLDTFPPEFREGMVERAPVIGDVGANAPEHWRGGLNHPERVDAIVTLHAATTEHLDDTTQDLLGRSDRGVALVGDLWDGRALANASTGEADVDHTKWAAAGDPRVVHFGYVDGVAQPRFKGIDTGPGTVAEGGYSPLGTVIVGQPSTMAHVHWRIPSPHVLGRSGTFNAFRVLEQDVEAFHRFLLDASSAPGLTPDLVAAKLCGRHLDGTPLADVDPVTGEMTFADDPDGHRCPLGAHVRRANPRDSTIVQRASNQTRRLVRRGMPYGPPFDPSHPSSAARGLLGNFLCANLAAQFESMQFDWINLGFQDPRITGTNDPLVGNHGDLDPPFVFCPDHQRDPDETVQLRPPLLVRTVGGAYTFLPSLAGLAHLAAGSPG